MMARAAPAKHKNPRQTVHNPADSDHRVAPIDNTTPMPIKLQGLAS